MKIFFFITNVFLTIISINIFLILSTKYDHSFFMNSQSVFYLNINDLIFACTASFLITLLAIIIPSFIAKKMNLFIFPAIVVIYCVTTFFFAIINSWIVTISMSITSYIFFRIYFIKRKVLFK